MSMKLQRAGMWTALVLLAAPAGAQAQRATYPPTARGDVVDDYHGTRVADPYRWLEDTNAEATAAWVTAQNRVTFGYLERIPGRERILQRLTELWNFERYGTPFRKGGHYFFFRNDGLQNQSVLYVQPTLAGEPRVLIDPNTLSEDGTVALTGALDVTEDGRHLAYGVAASGSDWQEFRVRDVATGADLPDRVRWVKFSDMSWTKDGRGFFYSRYPEPTEANRLLGENRHHMLYYHALGTRTGSTAATSPTTVATRSSTSGTAAATRTGCTSSTCAIR